ncbi:MAG: WYL domain-containing protein [Rhodospirillales bacterium CG15_BIG_FIL_POST_REV_8_21_14_020_66_15]|nr:MAG: WYL domain-containing protein [Rhodospirillales bacterium CG15_BIG_FIL_POST_REV_8_21_14_020_66_15]
MTEKANDILRYEKADNLLRLALDMQSTSAGMSLAEIQDRYGVGRRTAMRMRDAVLRNFPQAEEVETGERVKRWRIPPGVLGRHIGFSADELSDLHAAVDLLRATHREDRARNLEGLATKIKALMTAKAMRQVEPDLDALMEAEGLAMRPGPKPRIDVAVVEQLRRAIKGCNKVELKYRARSTGNTKERLVHPYGFLHGHRHYLIAWHDNPKARIFAPFALPNIERVTVLDEVFVRDKDFSLKVYAERSFGLFQEEPFDVAWRFAPEAVENARGFIFHPSQTMEDQPDGSLIVRFRAGSDLEMAWHLYCWGDAVEVLEPQSLADMVHGQRVKWKGFP